LNRGSYSDLTEKQVRAARRQLRDDFPNCIIDIDKYNGIDQGQEGACSLVALIHLVQLSGNQALFLESLGHVRRRWRRFWNPDPTSDNPDASPDLASTLDMVLQHDDPIGDCDCDDSSGAPKSKRLKTNERERKSNRRKTARSTKLLRSMGPLQYIPIRSEGNREQSFNRDFWCGLPDMLCQRFHIPRSGADLNIIPYVYENAFLVESAIDRGEPVAINALEHCRVAVAYNGTHLLFADSWSRHYTEKNRLGTDHNIGGFSVVDKWLVYCWMRDVVIARRA